MSARWLIGHPQDVAAEVARHQAELARTERLDNIALTVYTAMLGAAVALSLILVLCVVKP